MLGDNREGLPCLRFWKADLVIKLGHSTEDWLVIHSDLFAAVSPVYYAGSTIVWEKSASTDLIEHPGFGKHVPVRTLALKFAENTYILEAKNIFLDNNGTPPDQIVPFHRSALAIGWPDFDESESPAHANGYPVPEAARAVHVFFALLYGVRLDLRQITGDELFGEHCYMRRLVEAYAHAEFWGCLEAIKPQIIEALENDDIYEAVVYKPKAYALLAKKLRILELHNDALRRLIGQAFARDKETCEAAIGQQLQTS